MKTAFIIAGLDIHATATSKKHQQLQQAIEQKGYRVIPVDVSWRRTTPSQFADKFITIYEAEKGKSNIVIGNSFGAVVALVTAQRTKPEELLLCSLSPFFSEDITKNWPAKKEIRKLGKHRLKDIQKYSVREIIDVINKTNIKVKVLYGEKEHRTSPKVVARAKQTATMLNSANLIEIAHAPHPFSDPSYIKGIVAEL